MLTKAEVEGRLLAIARKAYLMVLSPGEPESPLASRMAGTPYCEDGQQWPVCRCSKPLQFICQVNLDACPLVEHAPNINLIQFFYCFHCCPYDEKQQGWLIKCHSAEVARFARPDVPITPEPRGLGKLLTGLGFKPRILKPCLIELVEIPSLPDWEDLESEHPEIVEAIDELEDVDATDYYSELHGKFAGHEAFDVDRVSMLGGYPLWVQGGDERFCQICQTKMVFFMSISSEEKAHLMFGDGGTVYLFNCPEHKDQFEILGETH